VSVTVDDFASRSDLSLTFETGTVDESTYTLKGNAALVADGERTALAVDSGYAALGKLTSIAAARAVTVAFDFNRTELAGKTTRLFWNDGRYGVSVTDGRYSVMVMGADGKQRTFQSAANTAGENGVWKSVALVLDSDAGTVRFYVDGALLIARDGVAMGFDTRPVGEATFGGGPRNGSGFIGLVDDLRIWDEALGAEQVARIGEPGTPAEALLVAEDAAAVAAGGAVTIDVLANDAGAGALAVTAVGTPAGGSVTIADGMLTYTARAGFWGTDRFDYTVADAAGRTASATVTVNVAAPDPLALTADAARIAACGTVLIDVLANDGGHGDLRITDIGTPSGGTVTLVGDRLHYEARAGFWGEDRFSYSVTDAFGQAGTAEVTVSVDRPDPLTLTADAVTLAAGGSATIAVLANDSGHGELRITDVDTPAGGTVTVVDGALRYEARDGFAGEDRFEYTVTDAFGQAGSAGVTVTVGTVVDSAEELMAALKAAEGGETILLAPGDYGKLDIYGPNAPWARYASEVTIRSLDPDQMARFGGLKLSEVSNITFDSILFDYVAKVDPVDYERPFQVLSSTAVTIRDSVFDGDLAVSSDPARHGYATGEGLFVRWSSDVTVEGNLFFEWHRGGHFLVNDNFVVRNNVVHSIRSDGFDFAAVQTALIEGNVFRDFVGSPATGDHMDMIQFWTAGTTRPTTDVTIRGNVLDSGSGSWTQSIFMRNDLVDTGVAGPELYYRNVRIEDNVIRNAHGNAIVVGETVGVVVANNTVAHSVATAAGSTMYVPIITVAAASEDVAITGNYAHAVSTARDGWTVADNVLIQRTTPGAPGYYGDIFTDGLADHRPAAEALRPYPGLETAGAPSATFDLRPDRPDAFVFATPGGGVARGDIGFRIGDVLDQTGPVSSRGATVLWDFGDGATSTASAPTHRYTEAGVYDTTARITLADGRTVLAQKTVEVEAPVAALVTFDGGLGDLSDVPNPVVTSAGITLVDGAWGKAVRLPGGSEAVTIGRSGELIGHDGYTVLLDYRKAEGTAAGHLVMFGYSFNIGLKSSEITAEVMTDVKSGWIRFSDPSIATTAWRQVALTFSGAEGRATLYLDGAPVGTLEGLSDAVQTGNPSQDIRLGSPWGGGMAGDIDNFTFLRGALSAEEVAAYARAPRPDSADDFDFGPVTDLTGGPWTDPW
jgi:hypothetical protein